MQLHSRLWKYVPAVVATISVAAIAAPAAQAVATSPPLGSAANFAVVAATTVTSTGPTTVTGDLGVWPGTAVVGFPPGIVHGTIHANDGPAMAAAADVLTAYNSAAGEPCDFTLSNPDLGGATLIPGVYCFTSTAVGLTGTLTLDAQGNPNAAWLFKTGSTLTTASNSAVVLKGGATPCNNNNITWQVGSSATLGTRTSFVGNILASASVTLDSGASSTGSLYAHTGAVTMDTNTVSTCAGAGGKAGPTVDTTPSGAVPVGGTVSDTATVIGGAAPTGSVRFDLFGPSDPTCSSAPIATRTGTLTGSSAASGGITVAAPGTYRWVATYSGDANNAAATSPCGSETVEVSAQILTGRAYGLTANVTDVFHHTLVNVAPTPDTGFISTPSSSTTTTPCVTTLSGLVGADVLCANVTTVASPGQSTASASVADATVGVPLIPTVTLHAVHSTSTTTCGGSAGTTTIDYLKVGSTVVIAQPTNVAPNTTISVGVVKLVLNEQIPVTSPDRGLTVNAVHVTVNALGLAAVNVIVASAESDIGNCP
ncbi:MAG TPA: ice-binding family protein [Solirubrobacteraceae bacterium]|nr:ice-binding family protein [Solirubrobacteraceae bacterium]